MYNSSEIALFIVAIMEYLHNTALETTVILKNSHNDRLQTTAHRIVENLRTVQIFVFFVPMLISRNKNCEILNR